MNFQRIAGIISKRRQRQIPVIVLAMVIGAAFEVIGISFVMPLMNVISGSENLITELFENFFGINDRKSVALISVSFFAFIYVLKGIYLSGLAWLIAKFTYTVKADVGSTLMARYLSMPYEFHMQKNSALLIRNLTTETVQLVLNVLNPLLVLISESVVVIAIVIFLIAIEPMGSIIVISSLLLLSYVFQWLIGDYIKTLGKIRQHADGMVIQHSQEALVGIKDVKILGKEVQFHDQFKKYFSSSSNVSALQNTFSQIPKMYLETIGVLVFLLLIFIVIIRGDRDYSEIVSVLGVFALAAFRLLPSAKSILSAVNSLRFGESVLNSLYSELSSTEKSEFLNRNSNVNFAQSSFQNVVEINDVYYQYPESREFALSGITLSIKKGESIGIIGKSGSGKSTLAYTILGLLPPTNGVISVDGKDIDSNIKEWQTLIGYVHQDTFLLDDTIKRNIAFGEIETEIDLDKLNAVMVEAQLDDFVENLPDGINTKLGENGVRLSGGQKQRIGIARALYRNAPILIFDEATSSLDSETETEIVSAIKSFQGIRTTIVIAHDLSTIEHCDRVIEIDKGQIHKIDLRTK